VRVISTTNRNIQSAIQEGNFREDLFYRLKVIDIELPPLRERKEDLPLLVQHFISKFGQGQKKNISGISEEAMKILLNYPWPGNVRELENIIQRAITLSQHDTITLEDLPVSMVEKTKENLVEKAFQGKYTMDQLEKEYIRKVLMEVGGNKSKAAEILGFDRKTLYRKLEQIE